MLSLKGPRVTRAIDAAKRMFDHLDRVRTFGLAAELAFWLFLSLIPLAAVAGLVAAKLATQHWSAVAPLLTSLPPMARDMIRDELTHVAAWNGGAVAAPAAAVFVWLASSGVHAVFDALEIQTSSSRSWVKKRLLAIATCFALSIGVAALALLSTGVDWIGRFLKGLPLAGAAVESSALGTVLRIATGGLVAFALNAGLYWVGIPHQDRKRLPIWPGALLAMVLEATLGLGYGFYIGKAGDGGAYQGALAVIGVTLMALYLLSVAVLVGAELNRYLGQRHGAIAPKNQPSRLHHPHTPPAPRDRAPFGHPPRTV
jgi:membrane protein